MQLFEPFSGAWHDTDGCGEVPTEAIYRFAAFYRAILKTSQSHARFICWGFRTIGRVVLLLDEYLNSAPKPLELDKDANQLEARNAGEVRRCDGKSGRVVRQMRELEPLELRHPWLQRAYPLLKPLLWLSISHITAHAHSSTLQLHISIYPAEYCHKTPFLLTLYSNIPV